MNKTKERISLTPALIHEKLNDFVVGQESFKKTMSVAGYLHMKRTYMLIDHPNHELKNTNIFVIGRSGMGKTLTVSKTAEILGFDHILCDCSALTPAGYKGLGIEEVLKQLYILCDKDKKRTETAIVILDEMDKMIDNSSNKTAGSVGFSAMPSLLKIIEGVDVSLPDECIINTSNMLFIGTGSCAGIEEVVRRRLEKSSPAKGRIGFNAESQKTDLTDDEIFLLVNDEDLIEFGFMPELIGRFSQFSVLPDLTKDEMKSIIKEPKNSVFNQYSEFLMVDLVELELTEDAAENISKKAIKTKTGARSIKSIFENIIFDAIYDLPSDANIGTIIIESDGDEECKTVLLEGKKARKTISPFKDTNYVDNLADELKSFETAEEFVKSVMDIMLMEGNASSYSQFMSTYWFLMAVSAMMVDQISDDEKLITSFLDLIELSENEDRNKTEIWFLDFLSEDLLSSSSENPFEKAYENFKEEIAKDNWNFERPLKQALRKYGRRKASTFEIEVEF